MEQRKLFNDGEFFVGVNYWASNAGTHMWREWEESAVRRDMALLAEAGIRVLRVFPIWSDFQPIKNLYGGGHTHRAVALDEFPAAHTPESAAGIDPVMADRFARFLDIAAEYGMSLMVGLLTGWMSGRQYIPPALDQLNTHTDPTAHKWEMKFIRYMVGRFKSHPAIVAWDIGNECNCMEQTDRADVAYTWSLMLANAIRAEDNTRPVLSGMHGLNPNGVWRPQDQGEIMDVLCTHPYPAFTPHCDTDPINRMKSANHAVAESLYYRGLGGKPCFAEEINTLGPMFGNEELTAANADMALFGLWAHNCCGYMWWCACIQSGLRQIPYEWDALERELGLIRPDGTHIKAMDRMTAFARFTADFGRLPGRITDAVCILVANQDSWAAAYGSFLLAKQAGIDLEFRYMDQEIPKADAYLLPALTLSGQPTRSLMEELTRRVREDGATLYLSMDGGMMSEFSEITGFELVSRSVRATDCKTTLNGREMHLYPQYQMQLRAKTARVLAADQTGAPVFGVNRYGRGSVYFLSAPIEQYTACSPAVVDGVNHQPYYEFYRALGIRSREKTAEAESPFIGLTEHIVDEAHRYALLINYLPEPAEARVTLKGGFHAAGIRSVDGTAALRSDDGGFTVSLPANSGAVIDLVQ